LAAKYLELVAKHDDLEVFRASRTDSEAGKCSDETVEEAKHERPGWEASALVSTHVRVSEPHRLGVTLSGLTAAIATLIAAAAPLRAK
jgi:hypothetical protein